MEGNNILIFVICVVRRRRSIRGHAFRRFWTRWSITKTQFPRQPIRMPNRHRHQLKWVCNYWLSYRSSTVNYTIHNLCLHVAYRHADWRLLTMHPEYFRRNPVHPSHLGGGHGRCDFRLSNCAMLLLCGKFPSSLFPIPLSVINNHAQYGSDIVGK